MSKHLTQVLRKIWQGSSNYKVRQGFDLALMLYFTFRGEFALAVVLYVCYWLIEICYVLEKNSFGVIFKDTVTINHSHKTKEQKNG